MATIDYGALLRVNGKFINKNQGLFMEMKDMCGFELGKADYSYNGEMYEVDINGNYFVYAGDESLLLTFYKGYLYVISNGKIVRTINNVPFISETFFIMDTYIKVSHLEPEFQTEENGIGTWDEYVREHWVGVTGEEKPYELQDGLKMYKWFLRRAKASKRYKGYKYRTQRWIAEWKHNGDKYEVIFGYGIDPDEKVWNDIKNDSYGFTEREIEKIDSWFNEKLKP